MLRFQIYSEINILYTNDLKKCGIYYIYFKLIILKQLFIVIRYLYRTIEDV